MAAGFFPEAEGHEVRRQEPIQDAILILCIAGRGWVQAGRGIAQPAGEDSLILLAPGAAHAYGAEDADPWSIYWAHFRGGDHAEFFKLFGATSESPVVRLPPGAVERVDFAGICERLEEDYTLPNLLDAATRLRRVFAELHRLRIRGDSGSGVDAIERTILWMREHLGEEANLSNLAKRAGFSIAHYSALFRQRTGYPPVDYFLRLKVRHACKLLDTTPLRITEIAAAIGYDDPFYFSRLFRRIMAKSPRAYRMAPKG